jgi:hypothetical protein
VAALQAGDTLVIRGGTYIEGILIENFQDLLDRPTVIKSYAGETVNLVAEQGVDGGYLVVHNSSWLEFDGINLLRNTSPAGFGFALLITSSSHHNTFKDMEVQNSGGGSCVGVSGPNNRFTNLRVHDCVPPPDYLPGAVHFYVTSSSNIFEQNYLYNFNTTGNTRQGISIGPVGDQPPCCPSNNIVRNNLIKLGGVSNAWGITLEGGDEHQVFNNIIDGGNAAGGVGIVLYDYVGSGLSGKNSRLYNNTLYNMETGIDIMFPSVNGTEIKNNIIYRTTNPIVDRGLGTLQSVNLSTDPLFVDPSTGNFRLQPGSMAIDTGLNLAPVVTMDIVGTPRPQGAGWDIGAYEYVGTTLLPPPQPPLKSSPSEPKPEKEFHFIILGILLVLVAVFAFLVIRGKKKI